MDRQSLPHEEARRIIRAKAAKYCRTGPFNPSDLDDLSQEVLMHLVTAWDRYDPAQGEPNPWMSRIIENKLVSIVRGDNAVKRGRRRTKPMAGTDLPGGDAPRVSDVRIDLAELRRALPPDLLEVLDMIRRHGSVSAAAHAEGIPRTTLRERVGRLRAILVQRGIVSATWMTDRVDQR